MAKVVHGDDVMFNAMTFGQASQDVSQFIDNQWQAAMQFVANPTSAIVQGINTLTEAINNSDVYRLAEAAMHYTASLWGRDVIQALPERWQVQNAPVSMIPYLMAQPEIRRLYNKGRCEGYGDDYIDVTPGAVDGELEDYRRVMDGVVSFDKKEKWEATTYFSLDETYASVAPLSHMQSLNIRDAWDLVADSIADGRDPTSRWDNDL